MSNTYKDKRGPTYIYKEREDLYITWGSIRQSALLITNGDVIKARALLKKSSIFNDEKIKRIIG